MTSATWEWVNEREGAWACNRDYDGAVERLRRVQLEYASSPRAIESTSAGGQCREEVAMAAAAAVTIVAALEAGTHSDRSSRAISRSTRFLRWKKAMSACGLFVWRPSQCLISADGYVLGFVLLWRATRCLVEGARLGVTASRRSVREGKVPSRAEPQ